MDSRLPGFIVLICLFAVPGISVAGPDSSSSLAEAFAVETEKQGRNILQSLDLSPAQKSEIQSILLAAIQSMDAVNAQLEELSSDKERLLSEDTQQMISALRKQRLQLAEMLSVKILSVLSPQQRSQLKLTPDIESAQEPVSEQAVVEYEI